MTVSADIPILETDRFRLRGHRVDDFDAIRGMWSDDSVIRYISGTPSSTEQSWSRFLHYPGHWMFLGYGYWVIEAKSDNRFIGEAGFANYKRALWPSLYDYPELGCVLRSEEHAKRIASEVVLRLTQWADENLPAERTVCIFDPDHTQSIKVALKAGYTEAFRTVYQNEPTLVMYRDKPPGQQRS